MKLMALLEIGAVEDRERRCESSCSRAAPDLLQFMRDPAHLRIGAVGSRSWLSTPFQYVSCPAWIGVPVPVLDHVGTAGNIGVDVQPKLPIARRKTAWASPIQVSARWSR